jgi:RHS repeat-associated protein
MEMDVESALTYFGTRFLAGKLSRFTRADPLALDAPVSWFTEPQKLNPYSYVGNNPLNYVDPTGMEGEKADSPRGKVLLVYGYEMYENFKKEVRGNPSKAEYEAALKASYAQEIGSSQVVVKNIESKEDLEKVLKNSAYTQLIVNSHGYLNYKAIRLGKDSHVSPDDLERYFGGAKSVPEKMYFYGCNTAKTGFASDLSARFNKTEVTGATEIIKPRYSWQTKGNKITNYSIQENRNYNKTFVNAGETYDARKVDINNAELPR